MREREKYYQGITRNYKESAQTITEAGKLQALQSARRRPGRANGVGPVPVWKFENQEKWWPESQQEEPMFQFKSRGRRKLTPTLKAITQE